MKVIATIFHTAFIILMLGIAGLFLLPLVPIDHNLELRIVESGSMEPAIMTGSLILVYPQQSYAAGDVIMFDGRFADVPTTHRVAETYTDNGRTWYVTKGDANEEADNEAVSGRDVLGAVKFTVPYAGYVLDFARQPLGFIFLIVFPALALVVGELEKIWREIRKFKKPVVASAPEPMRRRKVASTAPLHKAPQSASQVMMDIATPMRNRFTYTLDLRTMTPYRYEKVSFSPFPRTQLVGLIIAVLFGSTVVGISFLGSTVSYFNDIESTFDNMLAAVALDFSAVADGEIFSFEDGVLVGDDDGAVVTVVSLEPDSVDARYNVRTEYTGGDVLLCDAINAESSAPFIYNGPVLLLSADDVLFAAPWSLSLSLPDATGLTGGEVCNIDVVFTAWHFDEETDQGYFDVERVPLSFTMLGQELFVPTAQFFSAPLEVESLEDVLPPEEEVEGESELGEEQEDNKHENQEPLPDDVDENDEPEEVPTEDVVGENEEEEGEEPGEDELEVELEIEEEEENVEEELIEIEEPEEETADETVE